MSNLRTNDNFVEVVSAIRKNLPVSYVVGIISSYLINAAAVALFLYPILSKVLEVGGVALAVTGAIVIQFFRALIVLTDQLHYEKESTRKLVNIVAFCMTVFASVEAWHLVASLPDLTINEFWSVFLFLFGIVIGGFILEVNFIKKISELTDQVKAGATRATSTLPQPKKEIFGIEQMNGGRLGKSSTPDPTDLLLDLSHNGNGKY